MGLYVLRNAQKLVFWPTLLRTFTILKLGDLEDVLSKQQLCP